VIGNEGQVTSCFMTREPCILLPLLPSEKKVDGRGLHLLYLAKLRHCMHSFFFYISGVAKMAGVASSRWHYCNEGFHLLIVPALKVCESAPSLNSRRFKWYCILVQSCYAVGYTWGRATINLQYTWYSPALRMSFRSLQRRNPCSQNWKISRCITLNAFIQLMNKLAYEAGLQS